MIHTVEGSLHPEDGINSAETLAGLMPDVAHVVHMPSHIYIRTGYYRKTNSWHWVGLTMLASNLHNTTLTQF